MPEFDTVSPIEEARRRRPEPAQVHGAPVAGAFQLGNILFRRPQPEDVASIRIIRPWGDEERWVIFVDPVYGRIAIPGWAAVEIGLVTPQALAAVHATPEEVRAEAVAKANSEAASLEDQRKKDQQIQGVSFFKDLAEEAATQGGKAVGAAANGLAFVLGKFTNSVIKATPVLGVIGIGIGALALYVVTKARG